jgi:hypothetical protein
MGDLFAHDRRVTIPTLMAKGAFSGTSKTDVLLAMHT